MVHVFRSLSRLSSHPGRCPRLADSFPRRYPSHINLGPHTFTRVKFPGQVRAASFGNDFKKETQVELCTSPRFLLWNLKRFSRPGRSEWIRCESRRLFLFDLLINPEEDVFKSWMISFGCRSPSKDRFGAAAERGRRETRQRPYLQSRSAWTSSGATSITTTWCTNPSLSSSGVTRMHRTSRAGWWTTAKCPLISRFRRPTQPRSWERPERRTMPGWKGSRPGWGRGERRGRRRSAGGRKASTQLSPSSGSASPTCRRTQNCQKLKLYAWRPVTLLIWWTSWPKTPGRRKALRPKLRNLKTGIWNENGSW